MFYLLLLVVVCASAEYLFDEGVIEDVGAHVGRCLLDLPATVLGRPFDPSARPQLITGNAQGAALLVHPGSDVCMRQLMETLWEEGDLEDARNAVASCLFDHYRAAFEAAVITDDSPSATVLRGLECAINALELRLVD